MQKKLGVLMSLLLVITLGGCSTTGPCKIMTITWPKMPTFTDICPHERQYVVYGRVVDLECNGIEACKVVLIKRMYGSCKHKEGETLAEYSVAMTDKTGDYTFCFEPLGANDVWLYFDASAQGYNPQFIELNHLMGPTIFQTPGNSPVIVDMTLEKAT